MRTAVCSLAALLTLTAAGFGQASAKPDAVFAPGRFAHVKLFAGLERSDRNAAKLGAIPVQKFGTRLQPGVAQAPAACGHIGVVPVPPDVDPEFILPVPLNRNDRMPKIKGMPPCSEVRR